MWGKAIYFAVKAAYSHQYRHNLSNGTSQMFYARVIIGKTKQMNPDNTLIKPPKIEGSDKHYDSVKGFTGDSDVYMVYASRKAYPEYLITYQTAEEEIFTL
jgi:Poly(ADP-ribose) polymerase catalytic domain